MNGSRTKTTRRRFLTMVGGAGASTALLQSMTGMDPLGAAPAWAGPLRLPAAGNGEKVLILGAGIAGLTAAYELERAGYDCSILEAQQRAGGRNFTARRGSVVTETGDDGNAIRQECRFNDGLYLNMGPGRIPYHHRRVLHYCNELDVALEPYIMQTTANLFQSPSGFGGAPQPNRRVDHDTRGHIAELLTKAVNRGALDDQLGPDERKNVLKLLTKFADLRDDGTYRGSTRSGCRRPLHVRRVCAPPFPLELDDLLQSGFWTRRFYQPIDHLWQATMFQPVGGMDKIVEGFTRNIRSRITYGAEVTEIRLLDDAVEVTWRERGRTRGMRVDYCLSNIPLPVLKKITANFSPYFAAAVNHARFEPTCKVGWQANQRFWESDTYQIYGGISWIDHNITQIWYPSYDYFTERGTLTGAYNFEKDAEDLGDMPLDKRLEWAREGAKLLHPEFGDENIIPNRLGLSIAWHKVPYQLGGWALWKDVPADRVAYGRLLSPDRRFHVIGDQVSPLPGWQEGAMLSAEHVVKQVTNLESTAVPRIRRAPDSRALTQGLV